MSRIVRFPEPHQPTLLLGHGLVHWDTLPRPVRERVLALWTQLLTEHLAHVMDGSPAGVVATGTPAAASAEGRP